MGIIQLARQQGYLDARRGDKSSDAYRTLSTDMLSKSNISDKSETQQKKSEVRGETAKFGDFGSIGL